MGENSSFLIAFSLYYAYYTIPHPVIDCGSLPNPVNGQVMFTVTTYNSIVTYSCNTGYLEVGGTTSRTCQDDGNWSDSAPSCQSKSCMSTPPFSNSDANYLIDLIYIAVHQVAHWHRNNNMIATQ